MLILLPLLIWSAISQAILSASLIPLISMTMPENYTPDEEL
jgi:hypothetical protein